MPCALTNCLLYPVLLAAAVAFASAADPTTCAEAKALPACSATVTENCYGTYTEDCTTQPAAASTCLTQTFKKGDPITGDGSITAPFDETHSYCTQADNCAGIKAAMASMYGIDVACADSSTGCAVGNTCSPSGALLDSVDPCRVRTGQGFLVPPGTAQVSWIAA